MFVLFYLMTVFALNWGTSAPASRASSSLIQLSDVFFALMICCRRSSPTPSAARALIAATGRSASSLRAGAVAGGTAGAMLTMAVGLTDV